MKIQITPAGLAITGIALTAVGAFALGGIGWAFLAPGGMLTLWGVTAWVFDDWF